MGTADYLDRGFKSLSTSFVDTKGDGKNAVGVVSSHSGDLTMVSRGSVGYTRTGNLLRSVVG